MEAVKLELFNGDILEVEYTEEFVRRVIARFGLVDRSSLTEEHLKGFILEALKRA